jgi:hypothetical protein
MVNGMGRTTKNRRLRRQEMGKMEAAGFGEAALDALNCRKSEIVDIFLRHCRSYAPVADRTCENPVFAAVHGAACCKPTRH